MFLNNRHYDPTTGVFVSVDPLVTKTMQPYIYGAANPIRFSDPSGLDPDTSSIHRHRGYNYCTSAASTCSREKVRESYGKIHESDRGQGIFATIDVASEGEWGKLDGNTSDKDLVAAASGMNLGSLLHGDLAAIAMVQNVADAFLGFNDEWEQYDVDLPGFWNRSLHFAVDLGVSLAAVALVTGCVASVACGLALGTTAVAGTAIVGTGAHLAVDGVTGQEGPGSYGVHEAFRSSSFAAGTGAICALGFGRGCLFGAAQGPKAGMQGPRGYAITLMGIDSVATSDLPKPWTGMLP